MKSISRWSAVCASACLMACQPASVAPVDTPVRTPSATSTAASKPSTQSAPESERIAPMHWQCDEILLDARPRADAIRLDFSGRALQLPQVESLVGRRFADGAGNQFMREGDRATLLLWGAESRGCTRTTQLSPWNDAIARGMRFRAVGSEPGWFLEIDRGATPAMHATLDYGDRNIDIAKLQASSGGFTGSSADREPVILRIDRAPCQDGMSGEAFEATVTLTVAGNAYRGCGAFLDD
jgi:putative lipoprotein